MVSNPLRTGKATGIETIVSSQRKMSWGEGTVYIQRRMLDDEEDDDGEEVKFCN
jgi:hypothetical protein